MPSFLGGLFFKQKTKPLPKQESMPIDWQRFDFVNQQLLACNVQDAITLNTFISNFRHYISKIYPKMTEDEKKSLHYVGWITYLYLSQELFEGKGVNSDDYRQFAYMQKGAPSPRQQQRINIFAITGMACLLSTILIATLAPHAVIPYLLTATFIAGVGLLLSAYWMSVPSDLAAQMIGLNAAKNANLKNTSAETYQAEGSDGDPCPPP